jgi:hypothetical protein
MLEKDFLEGALNQLGLLIAITMIDRQSKL